MDSDFRKVAIIGAGRVGVTAAYALLLKGEADEVMLVSRTLDKALGEKADLEHGLSFLNASRVTATTNYADLADADVVVVTAGAAQQPGQSRLELIQENKRIISELAEQLRPHVQNSVVVVVTNPVDILTYQLAELLKLPAGRVFGSGTMLDTARFRFHLSELLRVHPRSIHAYVLGEHGDSSFPALAGATVGGQPLTDFPDYSLAKAQEAYQQTKNAAAQIIQAKGSTYYAIGVVITQLVQTILRNQRSVLPVSVPLDNYYGQSGVAASVPCIVGRNGVEQVLKIALSDDEQAQFAHSCQVLRQADSPSGA